MAGRYKITIDQGTTWRQLMTYKEDGDPTDLTTYTARMQIRPSFESATVLATLTTANGGITLGGALGTVLLTLTATQTAAIPPGTYLYDLELVNGPEVTRLVEGQVVVRPEVTR